MDKKSKVLSFLKKEGFYVILFVCICIVATVAAVTAKRNVEPNKPNNSITDDGKHDEVAENEDSPTIDFEGAELVDKGSEDNKVTDSSNKEQGKQEIASNKPKDETVETSSTPVKGFISPVNSGVITRTYNIRPRVNEAKIWEVFHGVDIECTDGAEVKAISEGTVLEASKGNSKEGYYVKVEHANGIVATYANLSEELNVKTGDKVKQGTVLGTIGNSVKTNPSDRVSSNYLLFHIEKSGSPVDPQTYLTDIPVK